MQVWSSSQPCPLLYGSFLRKLSQVCGNMSAHSSLFIVLRAKYPLFHQWYLLLSGQITMVFSQSMMWFSLLEWSDMPDFKFPRSTTLCDSSEEDCGISAVITCQGNTKPHWPANKKTRNKIRFVKTLWTYLDQEANPPEAANLVVPWDQSYNTEGGMKEEGKRYTEKC